MRTIIVSILGRALAPVVAAILSLFIVGRVLGYGTIACLDAFYFSAPILLFVEYVFLEAMYKESEMTVSERWKQAIPHIVVGLIIVVLAMLLGIAVEWLFGWTTAYWEENMMYGLFAIVLLLFVGLGFMAFSPKFDILTFSEYVILWVFVLLFTFVSYGVWRISIVIL